MPYTALSDTGAATAGRIDPQNPSAGTAASGWIDMGAYERIMAVVQTGALQTGNTVDAKLQQAKDTSGTGVKDITNAAITQLTKAATNDNEQAVINCGAESLDVNNGFRYARLLVTVGGTNTAFIGGVVYGDPDKKPPTNPTTVAQVVSV